MKYQSDTDGNGKWLGILAALSYGCVSFSMIVANKNVFHSFNFNYPSLVLVLQMGFTVLILRIARQAFDIVHFEDYSLLTNGRQLAFASSMYCANVCFGLSALSGLSLPVYQMIKRLTTMATLILAYFVLGKIPSRRVALAVVLIVIGTVMMSFGDVRFDIGAYLLGK